MSNYKICWVTLCFNEMDILPFVKQYWERIGCDVVVYDNGSTDGSIDYLSVLPYVTVKHFDSQGQNDIIQKEVKEKAYLELKDKYDIIIISDMDEVFYFKNEAVWDAFISGGYNVLATPIFSLCESSRPIYDDSKLLHQICHKFYKQKMNHMQGFEDISKLSIFNTKTTDSVVMSVGQHFVSTLPLKKIMLSNDGFCLHIDKGFGIEYKYNIRQKMNANLSSINKQYRMCIEYSDSFEKLAEEYKRNQENSFDINDRYNNN